MGRIGAASSPPRTRKSRARALHLQLVQPGNLADAIVLNTTFKHSNAIAHVQGANTYNILVVRGLRDRIGLASSAIKASELRTDVAVQESELIDLEEIQAPIIAQSSLRLAFALNRLIASSAMMRAVLFHIDALFPSWHGSFDITMHL